MSKGVKPGAKEDAHEVPQPDFERAIRVIRNDLMPLKKESESIRGEASAAWKIVEDECHCNKAALKEVAKLMKMEQPDRDSYLRSLYGGMKAANIGISEDLVSMMTDEDTPTMPVLPIDNAMKKAKAHLGGAPDALN